MLRFWVDSGDSCRAVATSTFQCRVLPGVHEQGLMVPDHPSADGAAVSREAAVFWKQQWVGRSMMAIGTQDPVFTPTRMEHLRQPTPAHPRLSASHAGWRRRTLRAGARCADRGCGVAIAAAVGRGRELAVPAISGRTSAQSRSSAITGSKTQADTATSESVNTRSFDAQSSERQPVGQTRIDCGQPRAACGA
jgi:hypothetical protein